MKPHREITEVEYSYLKWQNRATHWYLTSRLLIFESHFLTAAFSTQQTIELLLKATLLYWDKDFEPKKANHKFPVLLEKLYTSVNGAKEMQIPEYLLRYQSESRYIDKNSDNILGFPDSSVWIEDMDITFCKLIELVPFQFNSMLVNLFDDVHNKHYDILVRNNAQIQNLKRALGPWLKNSPFGLAPFPENL